MRGLAVLVALCALLPTPSADAFCRCHQKKAKATRCADPQAKHRLTVAIDLAVVDGTAEVVTQSGPYHVPVADLDGKTVLFLVTPRNVVFQGFNGDILAIGAGAMHGAQATITTGAVFPPGEYEVALFVDVVPGGGVGPQRGDLAAFDNTPCDPTGVSVRAVVGCEDATLTLVNRHFIIF
jgi:hypothetical protein